MKKGFTLIELLAVIVILAIIALIATPIVLNIINDTKKSALVRSADFYIDALENEIALENMKTGGNFNPNVCQITDGTISCDGKELTIKVDGEKPTSGSITFSDGKVADVDLKYPSGNITLNNKGELVLGESNNNSICKLIDDADNSNTITPGDKYQCKVKDDMETGFEDGYYFYVLSDNEDGTTNLIMERNINSDGTVATKAITKENAENGIYSLVEWMNYNDYQTVGGRSWEYFGSATDCGPITAMNYLYKATKDWSNVLDIVAGYKYKSEVAFNFDIKSLKVNETEYGYINLKARLPESVELELVGCLYTGGAGSCPVWLIGYLKDSGLEKYNNLTHLDGTIGYWTSSFVAQELSVSIDYDGAWSTGYTWPLLGIRPVITLPTDEL